MLSSQRQISAESHSYREKRNMTQHILCSYSSLLVLGETSSPRKDNEKLSHFCQNSFLKWGDVSFFFIFSLLVYIGVQSFCSRKLLLWRIWWTSLPHIIDEVMRKAWTCPTTGARKCPVPFKLELASQVILLLFPCHALQDAAQSRPQATEEK